MTEMKTKRLKPKSFTANSNIVFIWEFTKIMVAICTCLGLIYGLASDISTKPVKSVKQEAVNNQPVIVWYTEKDFRTGVNISWIPRDPKIECSNPNRNLSCDVLAASNYKGLPDGYIFYAKFIQDLPVRRPDTIWGIVNEESPREVPEFMYEGSWRMFNVSATFSRSSDVPMTLLWLHSSNYLTSRQLFVETTLKNTFLDDIAPVLYIQSNCDSFTDRDSYVQKLMKYIPVDSYGRCLHNKKFPEELKHYETDYFLHLYEEQLLKFIARYKFVVAIENAVCKDYVTEKLWKGLSAGVVPIYFGDPNIRDWLPNKKSAILLEDFPTPKLLSEHLHELLKNDTKYEEYLEHKIKGKISNKHLLKKIKEKSDEAAFGGAYNKLYCKMCEILHDIYNSSNIYVTSRKHYECSMPTSALTLSVNPKNKFVEVIEMARYRFI